MTAVTTASPAEVEARTASAMTAFDYSLRRWRQELLAEWRTPGRRPTDLDPPVMAIDYALDRLLRTLADIARDAGAAA